MCANINNEDHFEDRSNTISKCSSLSFTETFYIQLLADFLHKRKSSIDERIDWKELLNIAYVHGTEGIVYYQLRDSLNCDAVPNNARVRLFKAYADTCYKYDKRSKLLREADAEFQREDIKYLIFKGMDVADLYPVPKMRTMGDTDILVHESDKERAQAVLTRLGCETDGIGTCEWLCHRDDISIELHHALMYEKASVSSQQKKFYAQAWSYAVQEKDSCRCHLTWEYHLVYVIAHMRKHFIDSGAGFRLFLDIAVIISKNDLDWAWIEKTLKATQMWEFARTCLAFCKRWFDVAPSVKIEQIDEAFYIDATKSIVKGGTYGSHDPNNMFNSLVYVNRKGGTTFWWRLKWKLTLLFPSYGELSGAPRYSFLKGRAYLLPAVWVYRLFFHFRRRLRMIDGSEDAVLITKAQRQQRLEYLDKWGI